MYEYGTVGIIYTSLNFIILAVIRYWMYKDRLRMPIYHVIPIVAVLSMGSAVLWIVTGGISGMAYDIFRVMTSAVLFLLSCFLIKAPVSEHIFSYAFILAGTAAEETTALYIQTNFFSQSGEYVYPVISVLIITLFIIFAVGQLKKMIVHLSELKNDRVWLWLDIACFSFLFMNILVTLPHPEKMGILYPVGRYLMLIGMIGIYKVSVRMMDTMRAAADARAELELINKRVSIQQSFYDRMASQMEEVRRMKHDLRHHRAVLMAYIKNGDMAALSKYIDTTISVEKTVPVTGNLAADSILLYYMDMAGTLGVQINTKILFEHELPVTDSDLSVILGNLLENAVEAQRYVLPQKRCIRVTAYGDKTKLTLAVDNRFDGRSEVRDGKYISRKEGDSHGIGIGSVMAVCEKYGGILKLETKDEMFMAGVVIGL